VEELRQQVTPEEIAHTVEVLREDRLKDEAKRQKTRQKQAAAAEAVA